MSILVVGSAALDSVKTPFGKVTDALGGSSVYFSIAASFFTDVKLVAVVGSDFPEKYINILSQRNVDISGLEVAKGKTFRWKGEYNYDLNSAKTLDTQLNVFSSFKPVIPAELKNTKFVFLANIDPELQLNVLNQIKKPELVGCDTMNYWIQTKPKQLKKTLKYVDVLTINESEIRQFTGEHNLLKAAKKIFQIGPWGIVIKRGEYGALFVSKNELFSAPAYPLEDVFDPTGAGDSFAGGFMGYISACSKIKKDELRRAVITGSVMASFNVEAFSVNRLIKLTNAEINKRYTQFKHLTHFEHLKG